MRIAVRGIIKDLNESGAARPKTWHDFSPSIAVNVTHGREHRAIRRVIARPGHLNPSQEFIAMRGIIENRDPAVATPAKPHDDLIQPVAVKISGGDMELAVRGVVWVPSGVCPGLSRKRIGQLATERKPSAIGRKRSQSNGHFII